MRWRRSEASFLRHRLIDPRRLIHGSMQPISKGSADRDTSARSQEENTASAAFFDHVAIESTERWTRTNVFGSRVR
jgi:hypothetical protein